jgi:hypothetical protein
MAGIRKVSWTFQLNKKSFPVETIQQDSHYRAEMDQGVCNFGAMLSPQVHPENSSVIGVE